MAANIGGRLGVVVKNSSHETHKIHIYIIKVYYINTSNQERPKKRDSKTSKLKETQINLWTGFVKVGKMVASLQ